jgi:dihydrofolate reductase
VSEEGRSARSLVVAEYVSLDGVIQAPGHAGEDRDSGFAHGGWTGGFMAEHRRHNSQLFPAAGAFLLGRRTYEIFAAYWPRWHWPSVSASPRQLPGGSPGLRN